MSLENPLSILFNTEGIELAVSQSQALTGSGVQPGILSMGSGSDGNAHYMRVSNDGSTFVTGSVAINGQVAVSNFPAVQPVDDNGGSLTVDGTVTVTNTSGTPLFITSSADKPVFITGSVTATATLQPNTPVSQGLPGGILDAWNIKITDGVQVLGTGSSAPIWISGAVTSNIGNFPVTQSVKIDQSITLPVSVSNFPAIQVVTGVVGFQNNQGGSTNPLWVTGSFSTTFDPSTSATVTPVSSSATVVTLQAANGNRRGLMVYNDSTKILFLKLGSVASQTDFSVKMSSQAYFEIPGNYTGIVTGIWASANGFAYITEILD